ncbi:MAG: hypothetical protein HRF46_02480 [Acidobacteriota bacterium]|jgi:hypothetical protein
MLPEGDVQRFRELARRLASGSRPPGEPFDACRRLLAASRQGPEAGHALRVLLEGAMADAATSIADAQLIMVVLKAVDRSQLTLDKLLPP